MRSGYLIVLVLLLVFGFLLIVSGVILFNGQIEDESSKDWFGVNESFIVPAGEYVIREKEFDGGMLEVKFNASSGGVKFLALNNSNYLKWKNGQDVQSPFPNPGPVGSADIIFGVSDGKWFFIFDNSYDLTTNKEITSIITNYNQHILVRQIPEKD